MKAMTDDRMQKKMKHVPIFQFQTVLTEGLFLLQYESRRATSNLQSSNIPPCGDNHILVEINNNEKKGHKF